MNAIKSTLPDGGNLVCDECICIECDGSCECGQCFGAKVCESCGMECDVCEGTGKCKWCCGYGYVSVSQIEATPAQESKEVPTATKSSVEHNSIKPGGLRLIGYKIVRPEAGSTWMFAGTTPQEVANTVACELEGGMELDEQIVLVAFETTQEEIDNMPEFPGW